MTEGNTTARHVASAAEAVALLECLPCRTLPDWSDLDRVLDKLIELGWTPPGKVMVANLIEVAPKMHPKIDGRDFPWYVAADTITVDLEPAGPHRVTMTLYADHVLVPEEGGGRAAVVGD